MTVKSNNENMFESSNGSGTSNIEVKKLPLGVEPEDLYREKIKVRRLEELSRAIFEYIHQGFYSSEYAITITRWCGELTRRLKEFENK